MGEEEEETSFLAARQVHKTQFAGLAVETPHTFREKVLLLFPMLLFSLGPPWLNLFQDFGNTWIL